jgi:hypothetical protein
LALEIKGLRRKYLRIISIIRIIMTEQKSLLWLLVLIIRVRLELIGRILGVRLMALLNVLCLQSYIIRTQGRERWLRRFEPIANINRAKLFVGSDSNPAGPVRISQRHHSVAAGAPFLLSNVVEQLRTAIHSSIPATF